MTDPLTRRRFIAALAASVVAVGGVLPIGFPKELLLKTQVLNFYHSNLDQWEMYEHIRKQAMEVTGVTQYMVPKITC